MLHHGYCTQDGFIRGAVSTPSTAVSNCTIRRGGGFGKLGSEGSLIPLIVTGCARRIATTLGNATIPYLDALMAEAAVFKLAAAVYIFHDDPTDNTTLAVLNEWARRERRVRLILSDMGDRGERIQRLTLCRNMLLAEAAAKFRAQQAAQLPEGYVAQLDLDCRHGRPERLLSAVARMESTRRAAAPATERGPSGGFDVLTANNVGAYRDMWALRASALGMDFDCFWDFKQMRTHGNCKKSERAGNSHISIPALPCMRHPCAANDAAASDSAFDARPLPLMYVCAHRFRIFVHPKAAPFRVDAAFNGMAIMAAASLISAAASPCRYTNETHDQDDRRKIHVVSEHVPYQRCLTARGIRIAIEPTLLTYCHDWSSKPIGIEPLPHNLTCAIADSQRFDRVTPSTL